MPDYHPKATAYIASKPAPQQDICLALRNLILDSFPQLHEDYKWNYPAYYLGKKRICLMGAYKQHVTVELFYGSRLQDSKGLIGGIGKRTRHVKLKTLDDLDPAYFTDLIRQSIDLIRQSIVLAQSDSAK